MAGRLQFNLRGLLALTFFVACMCGLSRWLDDEGGFFITVPLAAIPLALLVEWMCDGRPKIEESLSRRRFAKRAAWILGLCIWISFGSNGPGQIQGIDRYLDSTSFLVAQMNSLHVPSVLSYGIRLTALLVFNWYLARAADPQPAPLRIPILLTYVTICYGLWFSLHLSSENQVHLSHFHSILQILFLAMFWIAWMFARMQARLWALLAWGVLFQSWLFSTAFQVLVVE